MTSATCACCKRKPATAKTIYCEACQVARARLLGLSPATLRRLEERAIVNLERIRSALGSRGDRRALS